MEAVLEELQSKTGVIGSLVVGENGSTVAYGSVEPERLCVELRQKLNNFLKLGRKNNPFDYIIFESETGKILVYNLNEKLLVILASQFANPLVIHSIVKKNNRRPVSKQVETKNEKPPAEIAKKTAAIEEQIKKLVSEPVETERRAVKPGLEELERAVLSVNTSSFPTSLDLILHLRLIYGHNRFLATRLLDFNGKELRAISREMKISIEAIVDFIERDPAIFSI